jgi:hypothetical protein
MRATARYGWRIAAVVAFGATAALAVTLSRGAPLPAALTSARHDAGLARSHEGAGAPRCTTSSLRISVGAGAGATTAGRTVTRYALGFTNVSSAACALDGYPGVAAYGGDGGQVGNAAAAASMTIASHVVLPSGGTARATVTASVPAATGGCLPVVAAGLRVVPPGESVARYVARRLVACSAAGPRAPVFLSVTAVQPVPSALAVFGTPPAGSRAARAERRPRTIRSPDHTALAAGQAA